MRLSRRSLPPCATKVCAPVELIPAPAAQSHLLAAMPVVLAVPVALLQLAAEVAVAPVVLVAIANVTGGAPFIPPAPILRVAGAGKTTAAASPLLPVIAKVLAVAVKYVTKPEVPPA